MLILRSFVVWLLIILVEIIHGIVRGILLVPKTGDLRSRQIGVFTGSLLIFAVAFIFADRCWLFLGITDCDIRDHISFFCGWRRYGPYPRGLRSAKWRPDADRLIVYALHADACFMASLEIQFRFLMMC
jgi:hypothetical protein